MGLLTIIKKVKRKEKEMRILIVGLDNAGKTTIVKQISGEDTSTVSPTLGFNIKTIQYKGFRLNIWDVGGQRSLRAYWRNYFEQTDALIWVVDCTDHSRVEAWPPASTCMPVNKTSDCRAEMKNLLIEERLAGASFLVLANKQDIPGAMSIQQVEQMLDLASLNSRHHKVVACSAITGSGLPKAVDWMVADVRSRIYMLDD